MKCITNKIFASVILISILLSSNIILYVYSGNSDNYINNTKTVACGNGFTVILKNDGTVWYFGRDIMSKEDGKSNKEIKKIDSLSNIVSIAAGGFDRVLALKSNGTVIEFSDKKLKQIEGLNDIVDIAISIEHSLALKKDGTVWTWGNNICGVLGFEDPLKKLATPVLVDGISDVKSVYADAEKSIVIKNDGTVWFWGTIGVILGYQVDHLVKENSTTEIHPKRIEGLTDIVKIVLQTGLPISNKHYLALKNDKTIWTWGANSSSQVGNNLSDIYIYSPVKFSGIDNVLSIADGVLESFAVQYDGSLWTWGGNKKILRQIHLNTKFISVFAGYDHYVAVDDSGSIWFGGNNNFFEQIGYTNVPEDTMFKSDDNIKIANYNINDNKIKVLYDNRFLNFDVEPHLLNGRTLVPIRAIAEAFNMNVVWDDSPKSIKLKSETPNILLNIDNKNITINNNPKTLEVAPQIISGRTLVPLRFITEAIGCNVEWDSQNKIINIVSK